VAGVGVRTQRPSPQLLTAILVALCSMPSARAVPNIGACFAKLVVQHGNESTASDLYTLSQLALPYDAVLNVSTVLTAMSARTGSSADWAHPG
jgi:uncharacterized lipoprotein YbaY